MNCAALALTIHLATAHFGNDWQYESFNPGIGIQCDHVAAGVYRNSFGRASAYVAWQAESTVVNSVALGAMAGLATGYDEPVMEGGSKIEPIGGVFVKYYLTPQTAVGLLAWPKWKDKSGGIHLTISRKINVAN